METQRQVNSTSAKLPALLIPEMPSSSRCATWIAGPLSGNALEIRGRIVSTPSGMSNTSQQGGGETPEGHFCSVPMIHPRRRSTMDSGELKSLLETMPVLSQNNWGALKVSEAEIKSAARRRVRKSRGEQPRPRLNKTRHNKTASSNVFVAFVVRMNADYGCERILTNCARLRGRKGEAAIWPSNFFDQRPGSGVWQRGQSPSGVNLYLSIEYPERWISNSPQLLQRVSSSPSTCPGRLPA